MCIPYESVIFCLQTLLEYLISRLTISEKEQVPDRHIEVFTQATIECTNTYQEIDITAMLGSFTPTYFLYFPYVQQLDVSGCNHFDTSLFVDCVTSLTNLIEIIMIGCTEFKESQLVRILINLQKLEIVDCTRATPLLFCNAYTVVSALRNLRIINVEPRYEVLELKDWKRLFSIFLDVKFGHSVTRILPFYGKSLRNSTNYQDYEH